ncbi:MAG: hypothetical protein M0036_14630 [Desulfobacteraceae bacterium]|nr:hypothetical protein [Desulfobacteraceae bacterium]
MKKERTAIEDFAMQILPEFLPIKSEIEIRDPHISKIRLFDRLFEVGYEKYQSEELKLVPEVKEPLLALLNKSHLEYSCFLAYSAGCIKAKYGAVVSREMYMKMIERAAKIGQEFLLKR